MQPNSVFCSKIIFKESIKNVLEMINKAEKRTIEIENVKSFESANSHYQIYEISAKVNSMGFAALTP